MWCIRAAQAAPSEKDTVVFKLKVDCKWKDKAAGEMENEKGASCAPFAPMVTGTTLLTPGFHTVDKKLAKLCACGGS